ncbi:MAG: MipA/OmpV family protein, partial [Alphaproteobacteria bacterium]
IDKHFALKSRGRGAELEYRPWKAVRLGPQIRYRSGRESDGDDPVDRLEEVDDALEVGAFIGGGVPVKLLGIDDPAVLSARIDVLQDVAGGHDGMIYEATLGVGRKLSETWRLGARASAVYGDGDFMSAFYDVTPEGAAASGLDRFDAEAGWQSVQVGLGLTYRFAENWTAGASIGLRSLVGDAASSPVTEEDGDKEQIFLGFIVRYRVF